jgi:hypothetical protein
MWRSSVFSIVWFFRFILFSDEFLQLSLAALMADHIIGVHEPRQFDAPLTIGGCECTFDVEVLFCLF